MKKNIKYRHAYDINENIVDILSLTKNNIKTSVLLMEPEYYSIGSHTPMVAALGEINQPHFKCKKGYQINPETELHQYAKKIIKHRFDTQKHFEVLFYKTQKCNLCESCIFSEQNESCDCLKKKQLFKVDLKQWYNTATIEKEYDNFVADVLLTNSTKPSRKPIFLEICVSHACEKNKIESKNKIIEIVVQKEEDAYSEIVQSTSEYDYIYDDEANPKINFYNFKDTELILCPHYSEHKIYTKERIMIETSPRGLSTKYYCVPQNYTINNPLEKYLELMQIGMLFASNSFAKPFVFNKALSIDKKKIIVLGKDIYGALKPWVVYQITFADNAYHHKYLSGHFDYESALHEFIISQGKEWTGEDVFSDYCN